MLWNEREKQYIDEINELRKQLQEREEMLLEVLLREKDTLEEYRSFQEEIIEFMKVAVESRKIDENATK